MNYLYEEIDEHIQWLINFMNEEYSKEDAYICRLSDEEAAEYIRENAERVEVIDTYLIGF